VNSAQGGMSKLASKPLTLEKAMNPEENRMLQTFLDQLAAVQGIEKDLEANALIRNAVARQPDAPYLLVQRALILEQALDQAKAEMARLQAQVSQAPAASRGFLDAHAWGRSGAGTGAHAGPSSNRAPNGLSMSAPYSARAARPGFLGAGGGSMLGTMAATAAGVAGGAFLFHGIGNLLDQGDETDAGNAPVADNTAAQPQPESAEPDAGTQELAGGNESGSMLDDLFGGDAGGEDSSLL
jgi:hypothetical protein